MTSKRKLSHPALEVAAMLAVQFATPSCGIRYGKGAEQSAQWFPPQVLRSIRRCISALMSRTEAIVFIVAPRRNECVPLVGLTANCVICCSGPVSDCPQQLRRVVLHIVDCLPSVRCCSTPSLVGVGPALPQSCQRDWLTIDINTIGSGLAPKFAPWPN
jgi:hypothetical protein